jgi:GNAT superfamily N-acetyltransferase
MKIEVAEASLPADVAYWLEMAEAFAFRDIATAAAEMPGNPAGSATASIGGGVAFALTVIDFGFFNRVVGLGVTQPATEDDVEAASRFFIDLGLTRSVIHAAPLAQPPELTSWLNARGYTPSALWVKLWHDFRELERPNPALRIERIDADQTRPWGDVVMAAFGMPDPIRPMVIATIGRPGWTHYIGFEGDTPVSAAAVRFEGDVAWLGYGATLPDWRGRGWQTAMFQQRLVDARDRGCRLAITETGAETESEPVNHSYRNMLRTGFRLAYGRRNWVRLPTTPA